MELPAVPAPFLLAGTRANHLPGHPENKTVRWLIRPVCYAEPWLTTTDGKQRSPQHVGAWLVFHQKSRYDHPDVYHRSVVPDELRMG